MQNMIYWVDSRTRDIAPEDRGKFFPGDEIYQKPLISPKDDECARHGWRHIMTTVWVELILRVGLVHNDVRI